MMAVWTDVTTGFDTEEETVNFGTRAVIGGSNGIFETLTLATIQPQGEVFFHIFYLFCFCVINIFNWYSSNGSECVLCSCTLVLVDFLLVVCSHSQYEG